MRKINVKSITDTVAQLCIKANTVLRKDVLDALKRAARSEKNKKAGNLLNILIDNARIAKRERLAICQDTGMACVYVEVGQGARITGGSLEKAVNDGIRLGYKIGYFRNSIVDPLTRKNTGTNTPAVIHTDMINGNRIKITVMPKGFGCENKNQIKMFGPTVGMDEVKNFIVDAVKAAGPDACPPYVVGVGIGGTLEKAVKLSKEALLKKVTRSPGHQVTSKKNKSIKDTSVLEKELLEEINKLNIGAGGFGGKTTALGVNVLCYPTHIAGLPVAVSIGCHAMRSATTTI